MRRWFVLLVALLAAVAGLTAPPASAEGTPIGNLNDTLRVNFKGIVADVTVHDVVPSRSAASGLRRERIAAVDQPRWTVEGAGHHPHDPGAQPVRDGPCVHVQRRHPICRRIRVQAHRRARLPGKRRCGMRHPGRRSTVPSTGRSTAPWSRTWCCSTRRPASTWPSGTSGSRERRYRRAVAIDVAAADEADLPELADVAARTFPLACPPSVTRTTSPRSSTRTCRRRGSATTWPIPTARCWPRATTVESWATSC